MSLVELLTLVLYLAIVAAVLYLVYWAITKLLGVFGAPAGAVVIVGVIFVLLFAIVVLSTLLGGGGWTPPRLLSR